MTTPSYFDPTDLPDGPSEYCWGAGLFPPGVANNQGQANPQDDFGEGYALQGLSAVPPNDGYALAVAMRRMDTLDPDAEPDFDVEGNCDRYGPNPPLVRELPQENVPWYEIFDIQPPETPRAP